MARAGEGGRGVCVVEVKGQGGAVYPSQRLVRGPFIGSLQGVGVRCRGVRPFEAMARRGRAAVMLVVVAQWWHGGVGDAGGEGGGWAGYYGSVVGRKD